MLRAAGFICNKNAKSVFGKVSQYNVQFSVIWLRQSLCTGAQISLSKGKEKHWSNFLSPETDSDTSSLQLGDHFYVRWGEVRDHCAHSDWTIWMDMRKHWILYDQDPRSVISGPISDKLKKVTAYARNLAIQYVSRYKGYNSIYCDLLQCFKLHVNY